ncbi:MAG: hypothetical protein ACYDDI_12170 [Candidatus Acidiferrales bacterium]
MEKKHDHLAHRGLTLPRQAVRRLHEVGIFAPSSVSLEHQHLAGRYVVRGIESGGAVKDFGRYVTFCGPGGERLKCLHPIDAIGVNGVHAVVVAAVLIRIELFRAGRTCQLLITKHQPGQIENGRRPPLEYDLLFRGVDGFLDHQPRGKKGGLLGPAIPRFWSGGGEEREVPAAFVAPIQAATLGASCIGCCHAHFLEEPTENR